MDMETIVSLQNAKVKKWTSLHNKKDRDKFGLFLVEGDHLLQEALTEKVVETILTDSPENYPYDNVIEVPSTILKKLSENVSTVHVIAVCRKLEKPILRNERLLILDGIQDPGNLGTLIRTAISFQFDGIYCSKNTCDLYNEKVIRSTQGALFHIPIIRTDLQLLVQDLKKKKVKVVATTLEHSKTIDEIPATDKMAFIMGNEGQGVTKELQKVSDERLRIDMHGFESLNVAVAGGIIMHAYRK